MRWWGWALVVAAGAVGFYAGVEVCKAEVRKKANAAGDSAVDWLFGKNSRYTDTLSGIVHQLTGQAVQ